MSQDDRPVWLLDVDGVVNALARGRVRGSWPARSWVHRVVDADMPGHGHMVLPILAARPVLDFVTEVVASGAVDVRWHSTWRTAAITELAPVLGLPFIPITVAPEWTDRPIGVWWKLGAAQRVVASGRRLVWTDDDLAALASEIGDLPDRPEVLLISPDREAGLTAAELQRIRAFLQL